MERKKIETEGDFKMAMGAVQSSMELLDMFDWKDWLRNESSFQSMGAIVDPDVFAAMKKDPQWDLKVSVFRAAANYMVAHHDIRTQLEKLNEK